MSVSRDAATAQEPGADLLSAAFLEAGFSHIAVQNTRTPAYEARRSIRSPPPLASPHTGPIRCSSRGFHLASVPTLRGYKNPLQQCGGVGGCDFEGRRQASAHRIHALMPTGHRRGQALRTVPTRSFAEQCVESHTWPPALSYRTPPYDTKLQATRPREAGHWTTTACAPPAC